LCSLEQRLLSKKNFRIMKLVVLLLTVTCLQVSAASYAQDVTLIKKNASLEKIFEDLYQQTGYQFVYSYDLMKKAKKVNVNAKDKPLKEVLENCFQNQPFTYKIRGNAVVVKKRSDKDIFSKLLKHEMIQREVHGTI